MRHEASEKIQRAHSRSLWLMEVAPRVSELPAPIQKFDDPFLPYFRAVYAATSDCAAGYVFDLAAFLALGAAGAVALERASAIITATPDILSVLHGPFTRPEYAAFAGPTALRVDAATVTSPEVATAFAAQGVVGLLAAPVSDGTGDSLDLAAGLARIDGVSFRIARQQFLDRFKREDFIQALRAAALAELAAQ